MKGKQECLCNVVHKKSEVVDDLWVDLELNQKRGFMIDFNKIFYDWVT